MAVGERPKERKASPSWTDYLRGIALWVMCMAFFGAVLFMMDDGKPHTPAGCLDSQYGDCEPGATTGPANEDYSRALAWRDRQETRFYKALRKAIGS